MATDKPKPAEPMCCLGCGRDTTSSSGYCYQCWPVNRTTPYGKGRGRKNLPPAESPPIEDDYSEDSDARCSREIPNA